MVGFVSGRRVAQLGGRRVAQLAGGGSSSASSPTARGRSRTKVESLDEDAMLTVVAHKVPHGAVPVEPAYVKDDGTRVTSFAPCLKRFGGGFELGTRAHELGLEEAIRKWQRRMDPGDGTRGDASQRPLLLVGAAPETFRMNYAVTAGEVARSRTFSSKHNRRMSTFWTFHWQLRVTRSFNPNWSDDSSSSVSFDSAIRPISAPNQISSEEIFFEILKSGNPLKFS